MSTVDIKGKIGAQDLNVGPGTFNRLTSSGSTIQLNRLNSTLIPVGYGTANAQIAGVSDIAFSVDDAIGAWIDVRAYGATGDGATDDTAAIQAAIDACPDGGTILFPPASSAYLITTLSIDKTLVLRGGGWFKYTNAAFGHSDWDSSSEVGGSIIRSSTTSGAAIVFQPASEAMRSIRIYDMAIVGPGSGTSVGVQIGTASIATVEDKFDNFLVANFYKGFEVRNSFEVNVTSTLMMGCTIGWDTPSLSSDVHFYRSTFQTCTTGIRLTQASAYSFHGCLFQNNTTSVLMQPATSGGIECITVSGWCWFEDTGGTSIHLDTTDGGFSHIKVYDVRIGAGTITLGSSNAVTHLLFTGVYAADIDLTIPSNYSDVSVINCKFKSVTDSTTKAVVLGDSFIRCIGWIKFNGATGAELSSNGMSVTKDSTGSYSITLGNTQLSGDYCAMVTVRYHGVANGLIGEAYNAGTTGFTVRVIDPNTAALTDSTEINVCAFI